VHLMLYFLSIDFSRFPTTVLDFCKISYMLASTYLCKSKTNSFWTNDLRAYISCLNSPILAPMRLPTNSRRSLVGKTYFWCFILHSLSSVSFLANSLSFS
jgi:hypothetical protein